MICTDIYDLLLKKQTIGLKVKNIKLVESNFIGGFSMV